MMIILEIVMTTKQLELIEDLSKLMIKYQNEPDCLLVISTAGLMATGTRLFRVKVGQAVEDIIAGKIAEFKLN